MVGHARRHRATRSTASTARRSNSAAQDEGAPGLRDVGGDGFYAAYFRDLDGNKLDVFCYG